jgi:hypothetical protein
MNWLDEFWADLLSEEPLRITAAWITLDAESQGSVREHLQRMVSEDGWQESQREAAQVALEVITEAKS